MATAISDTCTVCGKPGGLWVVIDGKPCMACITARMKAATNGGRCVCRKADKRPRTITTRSRSWVGCDRCLGTIKTL